MSLLPAVTAVRVAAQAPSDGEVADFLQIEEAQLTGMRLSGRDLNGVYNYLEQHWRPVKGPYTEYQRTADLVTLSDQLLTRGDLTKSPFLLDFEVGEIFSMAPEQVGRLSREGYFSGCILRTGSAKTQVYFLPSLTRRAELGWSTANDSTYTAEVREANIRDACKAVTAGGETVFVTMTMIEDVLDYKSLSPWWGDRELVGTQLSGGRTRMVWRPSVEAPISKRWDGSRDREMRHQIDGLIRAMDHSHFKDGGFCLLDRARMTRLTGDGSWHTAVTTNPTIAPGIRGGNTSWRGLARELFSSIASRGISPNRQLLDSFPEIHQRNLLVWSRRDLNLGTTVDLSIEPLQCDVTFTEKPADPFLTIKPYEVAVIDESVFFDGDNQLLPEDVRRELIQSFYNAYCVRKILFQQGELLAALPSAEARKLDEMIQSHALSNDMQQLQDNVRQLIEGPSFRRRPRRVAG